MDCKLYPVKCEECHNYKYYFKEILINKREGITYNELCYIKNNQVCNFEVTKRGTLVICIVKHK